MSCNGCYTEETQAPEYVRHVISLAHRYFSSGIRAKSVSTSHAGLIDVVLHCSLSCRAQKLSLVNWSQPHGRETNASTVIAVHPTFPYNTVCRAPQIFSCTNFHKFRVPAISHPYTPTTKTSSLNPFGSVLHLSSLTYDLIRRPVIVSPAPAPSSPSAPSAKSPPASSAAASAAPHPPPPVTASARRPHCYCGFVFFLEGGRTYVCRGGVGGV